MARKLPKRVLAKRRRLYSAAELALILGCCENTVYNLEARPIPDLLTKYMNAIGYNVAFYPVRKGEE